jgi:AbrB family looped-hinge helix DNA binding protein
VNSTSVTSKGQVTIPKVLRQKMGLRQGSKVEFVVVNDRIELRVVSTPARVAASGFGLLKSKRQAVPADFDAAVLAKQRTAHPK